MPIIVSIDTAHFLSAIFPGLLALRFQFPGQGSGGFIASTLAFRKGGRTSQVCLPILVWSTLPQERVTIRQSKQEEEVVT